MFAFEIFPTDSAHTHSLSLLSTAHATSHHSVITQNDATNERASYKDTKLYIKTNCIGFQQYTGKEYN